MDIIVVGGGPAGIFSALSAREGGHTVCILEAKERPMRKLRITGKGRCNLTNARPIEEFFDCVVRHRHFLYSAFYDLDNEALMQWFRSRGLALKTERGGRVFPSSDQSADVLSILQRALDAQGVRIQTQSKVTKITCRGNRITELTTPQGRVSADHYIFATGGASYPLTGSDGHMLPLLESIGMPITPFAPSLIPLVCKGEDAAKLAGVSLKNVGFRLAQGHRTLFEEQGELLFTHDGLSGPLVLSASAFYEAKATVSAHIDLKPALDEKTLDARILRDFAKYANRDLANGLGDLLIARLIPLVLERSGIPSDLKIHSVTRPMRQALVRTVKELTFPVQGTRPLAEAIVSRGGVDVSSIDASTMRSKVLENASVCGELLDVDALTGGYNLQIAFSTGHLAGGSL